MEMSEKEGVFKVRNFKKQNYEIVSSKLTKLKRKKCVNRNIIILLQGYVRNKKIKKRK